MASACEIVDGVFLQVLDTMPPTDKEWAAVLDLVKRRKTEIRMGLIVSEGGAPNASQRKLLADDLSDMVNSPRAVVTPSAMVRGAVTALSWLGHTMKAFAPDDLAKALDFLQLPERQREALLSTIAEMKKGLRSN